ncbi:GNAT family N-acetyltransferase [Yunchengibacter salinarum]|uniref:GNAT family N-acetyltransferase n=1 Tax=Yunchengibacter salinarum TaxID=3133399 RepID=UPI0035B6976F
MTILRQPIPAQPEHPVCHIRRARPADARAVIALQKVQFTASRHLNTEPDEFRPRLWRTMRRLGLSQVTDTRPVFLAEKAPGGALIGLLESFHDPRSRLRHSLSFMLGVHPRWQGRGVGGALLDRLISHVRDHPALERIELHVHSDNDVAQRLYHGRGFRLEGRRQAAVRFADGRVVDDLILALWPGGAPPARPGP